MNTPNINVVDTSQTQTHKMVPLIEDGFHHKKVQKARGKVFDALEDMAVNEVQYQVKDATDKIVKNISSQAATGALD